MDVPTTPTSYDAQLERKQVLEEKTALIQERDLLKSEVSMWQGVLSEVRKELNATGIVPTLAELKDAAAAGELGPRLKKAQQDLAEAERRLEANQRLIATGDAKIDAQRQQITANDRRITVLMDARQIHEEATRVARETYALASNDFQTKLTEAEKKVLAAQKEAAIWKEEGERLQKEQAERHTLLNSRVVRLSDQEDLYKKAAENLDRERTAWLEQKDAREAHLISVEAEISTLVGTLSEKQQDLERLNSHIEQRTEALHSLNQRTDRLTKKHEECLSVIHSDIEDLEKQKAVATESLAALQQEERLTNERLASREQRVAAYEKTAEDIVQELQARKDALQTELEEKAVRDMNLTDMLDADQKKYDALCEQLALKKAELEHARGEAEKQQAAIKEERSRYESEINRLTTELRSVQGDLQNTTLSLETRRQQEKALLEHRAAEELRLATKESDLAVYETRIRAAAVALTPPMQINL